MGAEPWVYITPYKQDVTTTLRELQEQEFRAGRYDQAGTVKDMLQEHGFEPSSIEELQGIMEDTGIGSILDIQSVSDSPEFFAVCPLPRERLLELYGTDKPTADLLETSDELFEDIDRGHGVYVIAYSDGEPSDIMFAGYSLD